MVKMLAVDSRSLPAADKGGGQTTAGRDDRDQEGIISFKEASSSNHSSVPAADKGDRQTTAGRDDWGQEGISPPGRLHHQNTVHYQQQTRAFVLPS